jgi:hypothetical protein
MLSRQLAGVAGDRRRLDQALAFEKGGEAGVTGVVQRGGAKSRLGES